MTRITRRLNPDGWSYTYTVHLADGRRLQAQGLYEAKRLAGEPQRLDFDGVEDDPEETVEVEEQPGLAKKIKGPWTQDIMKRFGFRMDSSRMERIERNVRRARDRVAPLSCSPQSLATGLADMDFDQIVVDQSDVRGEIDVQCRAPVGMTQAEAERAIREWARVYVPAGMWPKVTVTLRPDLENVTINIGLTDWMYA